MLKQSMLSLLLLTSLISSTQADSLSFVWQSEETTQEAQGENVKFEDACIAAVAGFCSAYIAEILALTTLNKLARNAGYECMPVLATSALYGLFSKKLIQADNQKVRMFGWGGLVGSSLIAMRACQAQALYRNSWCR